MPLLHNCPNIPKKINLPEAGEEKAMPKLLRKNQVNKFPCFGLLNTGLLLYKFCERIKL